MCGIVGYLDAAVSPAQGEALLARMRSAIRHRGPDDDGQFVGDGVGLGIQRLSIVDLSTGHQPMASADGKLCIVFNGEIYNHAELRRKHEAAGRLFRTKSDTEVILAQYEKRGLAGIHELNGMFAFALWDSRTAELHLVRDRLGVKPLYYFYDGTRTYFASEIKALIASAQFATEPSGRAVWDFLTFRYVPAPLTIWSRIFKLPPAHTLTLRLDRPHGKPRRYWDLPYVEPHSGQGNGDPEEFKALLEDAVRLRMIADVPVGLFLSGGLDSSVIAALVDRNAFPQLQTFSVTLEDAGEDDERTYAAQVARHLGTEHHEIVVSARDFIDLMPQVPRLTDEPMADPTCIPVFMLAKTAQEHVKAVLSGEGADELLAGYTFDQLQKLWDRTTVDSATKLGGSPAHVDQRRVPVPAHMTNYLSSEEKQAMFVGRKSHPDSIDVLRTELSRVSDGNPLHQCLYLYCQNWLVEDLLMKADKMTMAASIELRTPFLDYRVVEWAARAPIGAKLRPLKDGNYETKAVLRDNARGLLPSAIVDRPKKGFPVPVYRWLSDRLRPVAFELLSDRPHCGRWLEPDALHVALNAGTAPNAKTFDRHRLWNLMVLELWAQAWLP